MKRQTQKCQKQRNQGPLNPHESPSRSSDDRFYLKELLQASKEAEKLISCFFDLNAIEGEPFQGIWDRLALAIETAQRALWPSYPDLHEAADESPLIRRGA
jgi:hypothetical protein